MRLMRRLMNKNEKMKRKKNNLTYLQLNEAYEEVDEQKRDVASWKKKTQKANSELDIMPTMMLNIVDDNALDYDDNKTNTKYQ